MMPNRAKILKDLRNGVVSFSFNKANGELREMKATLVTRKIPEDKQPREDKNYNPTMKEDVIRCFDVDIGEWRSFNISSLVSYNGIVEDCV